LADIALGEVKEVVVYKVAGQDFRNDCPVLLLKPDWRSLL